MVLEHSNPHIVYNKKKKDLMQSGNSRKIRHLVLTLPIALLFLDQWHNTCEVTNFTERRMQKSIFCHDNCKNLAKMKQVHQCAVGLCPKIMTLTWNNCAAFYVQIMCMTQGTSLFEQSSFSFHCHRCCFISQSEVKFLCGIIVEVWNSTYVVLIIMYVFILKMVCFFRFFEM